MIWKRVMNISYLAEDEISLEAFGCDSLTTRGRP